MCDILVNMTFLLLQQFLTHSVSDPARPFCALFNNFWGSDTSWPTNTQITFWSLTTTIKLVCPLSNSWTWRRRVPQCAVKNRVNFCFHTFLYKVLYHRSNLFFFFFFHLQKSLHGTTIDRGPYLSSPPRALTRHVFTAKRWFIIAREPRCTSADFWWWFRELFKLHGYGSSRGTSNN